MILILPDALSKACGDGKTIVDVSKFPRFVHLLSSCCCEYLRSVLS